MIYFDEKSVAETMYNEQRFIKTFCTSELSILAKWFRYKKSLELNKSLEEFTDEENSQIDKEIEDKLIAFSEKCYPNFNHVINYVEIDNAVMISKRYRLKLPNPIAITQSEWDSIMSIDNDDYRRVLFVALVDAKYYSENRTTVGNDSVAASNIYWNRMSDAEIVKLAKTHLKTAYDKRHVWYYLTQNNYTGIFSGRNTTPYVNIVNKESEVIDYITDYEHLDLHYEKLTGKNIGVCKQCGCLFRPNKQNNTLYCYKHRGYQKKTLHFGKCVDCGKEFSVPANNRSKVRCDECSKEKRRNDIRKNVQKYRENKM